MSNGVKISSIKKQKPTSKANSNKAKGLSDILNMEISLGSKVSDKWKEQFYDELQTLMSAGLDILSSLKLIEEEQAKDEHKAILKNLTERIISGSSFSEALKEEQLFSGYEYNSIQIGEETGRLPLVLVDLANHYKKSIAQQRQLVSALTYPVLVIATAILAVYFMLGFIVPIFADVFTRSGGELPTLTRYVLEASDLIQTYGLKILVAVLLLIGITYLNRKALWYRKWSAIILLKLPVIGGIVHATYLFRFCQVMALLMSARVPMIRATQMIGDMIGFYPIQNILGDIERSILEGKSLNASMAEHPIYPKRMVALVKVGEEVNELDKIFSRIAQQYSEEVAHKIGLLGSLLEPILLIVLGLVVGFILIAMYLPMFSLSNGLM